MTSTDTLALGRNAVVSRITTIVWTRQVDTFFHARRRCQTFPERSFLFPLLIAGEQKAVVNK